MYGRVCDELLCDSEFVSDFSFFKQTFESNEPNDPSTLQSVYGLTLWIDRLCVCVDGQPFGPPMAKRQPESPGGKNRQAGTFVAKSCWFDAECARV